MSKVAGIIMALVGLVLSVYTFFLYLNSTAFLKYNPADKTAHMSDFGLVMPMITGLFLFTLGTTFLLIAQESNELKD